MNKKENKQIKFGAKVLAAFLAVLMLAGTVFAVVSYIVG